VIVWTKENQSEFFAALGELWPGAGGARQMPGRLAKRWLFNVERWPLKVVLQALDEIKDEEKTIRIPTISAVTDRASTIWVKVCSMYGQRQAGSWVPEGPGITMKEWLETDDLSWASEGTRAYIEQNRERWMRGASLSQAVLKNVPRAESLYELRQQALRRLRGVAEAIREPGEDDGGAP
jgi:hypothetical protein